MFTSVTGRINRASREIHDYLVAGLNERDFGTHIGTLLSSTARLAGTSLFRSFNLKIDHLEAGAVILSNEANVGVPKLGTLLFMILDQNGIKVDPNKLITEPPTDETPHLEILEVQSRFQDGYNQIARKHNLDFEEGAHAGVLTCATVIFRIAHAFDPHNLCGMAVYGFAEGAKTVPVPMKTINKKPGLLDSLFGMR